MYLDKTDEVLNAEDRDEVDISKLRHVGKTGLFVPVLAKGGTLYRLHDGKFYAVSGTKGYRWVEADGAVEMGERGELEIDMSYFEKLKEDAITTIGKFGSFEEFVATS
jgi:hypothetical protein